MESPISCDNGQGVPITWAEVHALMDELRHMATMLLGLEGNAQSLQPTALVLTALRRQKPAGTDWGEVSWPNRKYFFGAAHEAMRRALIDHARKRKRKRVLRAVRLEEVRLDDLAQLVQHHPEQVEALTVALARLRERHPDWAEVVEHRYFSGYTLEETACVMEVGERTVRRWWEQARLLLYDEVLRILTDENVEVEDAHEIAE
jgi:RNA polymerase sigma factor (TIGR02999 family)